MSKTTKGLLSILVPVIVWGISFVSTEYLLGIMEPMSIGAIRFTIATLILYIMMKVKKEPLKVNRKDRPLFILAGAIGIAVYFFFENTGIKYISASPASLIVAAIPIFTLIFESLVFKRRFSKIDILAVIISLVGVILIVDLSEGLSLRSDAMIGYLMMIGAVAAWVIYSLASKPLFERYSYLTIVFYQFLYSVPFFIPFLFFEKNNWSAIGAVEVGHLVFLAIFASVLGFYYYAVAMDLLGVTESSIFINFIPIVTIAFSFFYLGQWVGVKELIGGILIMLSVTLTTIEDRKTKKHNPLDIQ